MLSRLEKMVVISSTANEWPQVQIDEKTLITSSTIMEKQGQETLTQSQQQQQQQQPLKCPRCDSSNTKFCYYNNYSLSQPRHFCKACKRYWTRGGTLRNVPVGGGCRKNKRVKRSAVDGVGGVTSMSTTTSSANPNAPSQTQIDSNHISPLFYGLSSNINPPEINLEFPARFNSRIISSSNMNSGFDLQPQLNALALGFSSGIISTNDAANGFSPTKQTQDVVTSNSLLYTYNSILGNSSTTACPSMAALLASSLYQDKFTTASVKENLFRTLTPFEDLQISANNESGNSMKEVKMEQGNWNVPYQNHLDQMGNTDPSLFWNASTNGSVGSAWHDPGNIGSSVTSLI